MRAGKLEVLTQEIGKVQAWQNDCIDALAIDEKGNGK
jgi:hypothetical protein